MLFESIDALKQLKSFNIKLKDVKSFLKGVSKLGYGYIDYNNFIHDIKTNGATTLYNEDDEPLRIVASFLETDEFSFIRIEQINTKEDMYVVFYNHKLDDGYGKNNVQLVYDEHSFDGVEIIEGNLSDNEVEKIINTEKYTDNNGIVYKVRQISQ